jgi:transcriptional regulator with XRE-family HTH domain
MKLDEKLHKQMLLKGLNGQKLAKLSQVSDSEISRILAGRSLPGLENAFRLAKAVGVSLDYLADDSLESDPAKSSDVASDLERGLLRTARDIGPREAAQLLEIARFVGYETAMRRLLDAKPIIEVAEPNRVPTPMVTPAQPRMTSA